MSAVLGRLFADLATYLIGQAQNYSYFLDHPKSWHRHTQISLADVLVKYRIRKPPSYEGLM